MKKPSKPQKIADVLNTVLSKHGYKEHYFKALIIKQWPDIVGEKIAENSQCTDVREGNLYIKVTSSAWRQEISYLKSDILDRIKKVVENSGVKDIVFY